MHGLFGLDGRQGHGEQSATGASQGVCDIITLLCGHGLNGVILLLCLRGSGSSRKGV